MEGMQKEQMAERAPQGEEQGGDQLAAFVQNLGQGLSTLKEMVAATKGAPPQAVELADGIMAQYEQLLEVMSGGGQPQERGVRPEPVQQPEGQPVGV